MEQVDPVSGTRMEQGAPSAVRSRAVSTLLVDRAADLLRAGPASSQQLVATVCQLSALPPAICPGARSQWRCSRRSSALQVARQTADCPARRTRSSFMEDRDGR